MLDLENESVHESDVERKRKVIRKLVTKDDVALNVAKAGVQQAENLDYDEIFLWCLDNEYETGIINDLATQFEADIGNKVSNIFYAFH